MTSPRTRASPLRTGLMAGAILLAVSALYLAAAPSGAPGPSPVLPAINSFALIGFAEWSWTGIQSKISGGLKEIVAYFETRQGMIQLMALGVILGLYILVRSKPKTKPG